MFAEEMMAVNQNLMPCFWKIHDVERTPSSEDNSSPEEIANLGVQHADSRIIRKHRWTDLEDRQLGDAVRVYGAGNWILISKNVPTRSAKQCRERWMVHHDNKFARTQWTKEEDGILIRLQRKMGNKFSIIAKSIKNRSPIDVKNRWKFLKNHNLIEMYDEAASLENEPNDQIFQIFDDSQEF